MKIFFRSYWLSRKRLLIQLLEEGHRVVCSVRDKKRLNLKLYQNHLDKIEIIENDFFRQKYTSQYPKRHRFCLLLGAFYVF